MTHFHIATISAHPELSRHTKLSPVRQRLYIVADIVYQSLIDDVRELVVNSVKKEIAPIVEDTSHSLYAFSRVRRSNLKVWKRFDHPCSFGDEQATFTALAHTVSRNATELQEALPKSTHHNWSIADFVENVFTQAAKSSTATFRAPIVPHGSFGATLRVAILHAREIHSNIPPADADKEFKSVLLRVFSNNRIAFVPDSLPNPAGTGAPSRTPSIHAWTFLGCSATEHSLAPSNLPSQELRTEAIVARNARVLADKDVNMDWNTEEIPLYKLHQYLNHATIPSNFDVSDAQGQHPNRDITAIYNQACEHLTENILDWKCHLAILLGILISKMVPHVSWDAALRLKASNFSYSRPFETMQYVRDNVPWVMRGTGKGTKNESLYFSCAAVIFYSWINKKSLLYKKIGDIARVWNSKHCTFLRVLARPLRRLAHAFHPRS